MHAGQKQESITSKTYPEGNHGRKIKGADTRADTQGLPIGIGVHVLGDRAKCLPQLQASDGTCMLHHLWAQARRKREQLIIIKYYLKDAIICGHYF